MSDKIVHFVMYVPLGFLLQRSLPGGAWQGRQVMLSTLYGALYGASDELHQLLVPMRSCSLGDWIVDVVAVAAGAVAFRTYAAFAGAPGTCLSTDKIVDSGRQTP